MYALISGFSYDMLPFDGPLRKEVIRTAFGEPSAPLYFSRMGNHDVVFLARHGIRPYLAPHEINYRANITALKTVGVREIIATGSVIGLVEGFTAGRLLLPHDIIDYTWGRTASFSEGRDKETLYTVFSPPYDDTLRKQLKTAGERAAPDMAFPDHAVYACLQGPRLPTIAECRRYAADGAAVAGMTGMPEAVLAREAGMAYAHLNIVSAHVSDDPARAAAFRAPVRSAVEAAGRILQSI